ncbi:kinase-like domain, phloem protein 2-like protein [Tanacetum coccineum]
MISNQPPTTLMKARLSEEEDLEKCIDRRKHLSLSMRREKPGGEMVLIYEYACRGSLDRLLSLPALTWTHRLRICIDAAKGLSFLHDPNGTQQRVLHCDIKSSNILLDKNMAAKVSDFGLSKMGPANQQYSLLVTSALGTPGYCDPIFLDTYSLTKESDVYSFGVVLIEILSGKICAEKIGSELKVYVPFWKKGYEENNIAFQCLRKAREERPTMSRVVEELEIALESQEFPDLRLEVLTRYEEILKAVDPLQTYWLSINEKGQHIERIYIQACLDRAEIEADDLQLPSLGIVNSRFPGGQCYNYCYGFEARVRAEYLSPQILYTVNLVFRYEYEPNVNSYKPLRYKFTSQRTTVDLLFELEVRHMSLLVAGFEFRPLEEKVELQQYQDIVEVASQFVFYKSLDELKQILSKGVHLNGYKTWFSLNEKGEHCHIISMKDCLIPNEDFPSRYESDFRSRFPAGLYQTNNKGFKTHVKTQFLSPSITYTVNLVLDSFSFGEQAYVDLKYRLKGETTTSTVYLANRRDDDMCHIVELYQFTSDGSIVDLEIDFDDHGTNLRVEGILFRPLEIVEDQGSKDDKVENFQTISDSESDTYWEQMFPNDYEEILNLSKESLMWTTKKELYSILIRGFMINNGQEWFTVDKHGKKCPMLSPRAVWVIDDKNSTCESSYESSKYESSKVALYAVFT